MLTLPLQAREAETKAEAAAESAAAAAKEKAAAEQEERQGIPVHYRVDRSWVQSSHQRLLWLAPPGAGEDGWVRRLVMPLRLEDMHLMSSVGVEHLRAEIWPRSGAEPRLQVRVMTDALLIMPENLAGGSGRRRATRLRHSRRWLLLLEATVGLPSGLLLAHCMPEWRWADLAESESQAREAIQAPFRVLEVSCPLFHRSRPEMPKGGRGIDLNYF